MAKHDFQDRHVLITGASSGIGEALALAFAKAGARVGLVARRQDALDGVLTRIKQAGGHGATAAADVTDETALFSAVKTLEDSLGPVYGLIANAGISGLSRGGQLTFDVAAKCVEVNILGVIRSIVAVQDGLRERNEGFIATVSSLAAYRGLPGSAPYCATKAAVTALTESLRVDWRSSPVTLTTIHPGFVKTPLTEGAKNPQPFLMEVNEAAELIVRKMRKGPSEINFPWQLAILMRTVRRFPNWIYDWTLGRS